MKSPCSALYLELRPDQLAEHSCATLPDVLGHGPHNEGGGVRDVGQVDGDRVGLAGQPRTNSSTKAIILDDRQGTPDWVPFGPRTFYT